MWSPQSRGHLSLAITFSLSLEPKYSANETAVRGQPPTFGFTLGDLLRILLTKKIGEFHFLSKCRNSAFDKKKKGGET